MPTPVDISNLALPRGIPKGDLRFGEQVLGNIITIVFVVGIVLALFNLIYAGIQWISSGGDKEKLGKARSRILYSIIGLVVMLLAFFIINLIGGFFGLNYFSGGRMFEAGR